MRILRRMSAWTESRTETEQRDPDLDALAGAGLLDEADQVLAALDAGDLPAGEMLTPQQVRDRIAARRTA